MVSHLPFKKKVTFFFLLILAAFLVNAVQAMIHYQANQASWLQDHRTRQISILIHDIENESDHAHREVLHFLSTKDAAVADRLVERLQTIPARLKELDALLILPEDDSRARVREAVGFQLELFLIIRKKLLEIGLNENSGEHGRIREEIHRVEERLAGEREFAALASMLQLRRHEKDFMDRKQMLYLEKFNVEVERFQELLNRSEMLTREEKKELRTLFGSYVNGFHTIVGEFLAVNQLIEKFRDGEQETERALEGLQASLEVIFRSHDDQQRELLFDQFIRSQITIFLVLLGIGLLLAWFQYDLLHSVNELRETARRVAAGEDSVIRVERRDE
ncbi:MAG: hypothetical protein HQL95_12965, partial [Magnetococcales bacterium]|nr:hypothetical protein [Magnetococcales bacterium]